MEEVPDFSGWATKNDLICTDGRIIKAGAFAHMDKKRVPLVWQHQHNDSTNLLGYVDLESRAFGVYAHGFFNETFKGKEAKEQVRHGDIVALSIYANQLTERTTSRGCEVYHGDIKEVSLVLAGANPGALIENVNIMHGDSFTTSVGEAIIHTGLGLEKVLHHDDHNEDETMAEDANINHAAVVEKETDEKAVDLVALFDTFTEEQKNLFYWTLDQAIAAKEKEDDLDDSDDEPDDSDEDDDDDNLEKSKKAKSVAHADDSEAVEEESEEEPSEESDETEEESEESEEDSDNSVTHTAEAEGNSLEHANNTFENIQEGNSKMSRNVFEEKNNQVTEAKKSLSHSTLTAILNDAKTNGSLKDAFIAHAGADYGIEDIDFLFPDAKTITATPEFLSRRMPWVSKVLGGVKHSPIARIKSVVADITADEARAKGYVKGNVKKDEIIKLLKRVTNPTTIYKKQKLDRDDIVDITDLDVVAWLKAEMRLMLDEELARAILIGDGREADDPDKINEDHIRPIATDNDMYTEKITLASNASPAAFEEAILRSRAKYRGSGTPDLFTTDENLTDLLLQKDTTGRRIHASEAELAASLRVASTTVVDVMEDSAGLLAVIVSLPDYTIGADKGGQLGMFDDFDIDYNQYKYLIETRVSGALTKPKSAIVIRRAAGNVVVPTQPTYNAITRVITIPAIDGVIYSIDGVDVTPGAQPAITATADVEAAPAPGYSFPASVETSWVFVY